jgi:hypothetical protein
MKLRTARKVMKMPGTKASRTYPQRTFSEAWKRLNKMFRGRKKRFLERVEEIKRKHCCP